MLYILLDEEYRFEVNALVKLFFPEEAFSFISDSISITNGVILQCIIRQTHVQGVFHENNKVLYQETMQIDSGNPSGSNPVKIPLKILIYRILSKYTGICLPWGVLTGIRPTKIVHSLIKEGKTKGEIHQKLTGYYQISKRKAQLVMEVAENNRRYFTGVLPGKHIERMFNIKNVEHYINRIDEVVDRKREALEKQWNL